MVKHTQTICLTNCLSMFDHFVILALKTIRTMLEKLRVITCKNVKQKFSQSIFKQSDQQGFLKDAEVKLVDKTQGILLDENI